MILFYVANRLVRARNVRFAVVNVTGNVKHIRNGDYRLLSGGGGGGEKNPPPTPPPDR